MIELKEVFIREKRSEQSKQTIIDDFKQCESETQFLMHPKTTEVESRESYSEGEDRFVFTETDSCDDFKKIGVREFSFSADSPRPSQPERRDFIRRVLIRSSELGQIGLKDKTQVKFSDAEICEEIICPSEVSLTESIPVRNVHNFTPRLSYVKERPSTNQATLLALSENVIRLNVAQEVEVSNVDEVHHNWEVDSKFNIMEILKPVIKTSTKAKRESTQTEPIITENAEEDDPSVSSSLKNEERCCEFLSPVAAANLFITDTLSNAKEAYYKIVALYGDPDRWSVRSSNKPHKISSRWPQIKNFTKESGLYCIENYIVSCSRLREDWKYTIFFQDVKENNVSDHYYYEVIFGLPNRLYPIPQATASLYFHVEVSRIVPPQCPVKVLFNTEVSGYQIDPENYILKDNVLLRILDMKLLYFKRIYF